MMRTKDLAFLARATPAGAPPSPGFRVDYRSTARGASSGADTLAGMAIGPAAERDTIYILNAFGYTDQVTTRSATLGGQACTEVTSIRVDGNPLGRLAIVSLWRVTTVAGDSAVDFVLTGSPGTNEFHAAAIWSAMDVGSENIVSQGDTAFSPATLTLSQNVVSGDIVIAMGVARDASGTVYSDSGNFTTTGLTERADQRTRADQNVTAYVAADHTATGTETPRTISFAVTNLDLGNAGISLRLRA